MRYYLCCCCRLPMPLSLHCFCCFRCVRACFRTKLVYINFQLKPLIFGEANTNITSHSSFEHYDFMYVCVCVCDSAVGCLCLHAYYVNLPMVVGNGGGDSIMFPFELLSSSHKHTHTQNAIRKINFQNHSFDGWK